MANNQYKTNFLIAEVSGFLFLVLTAMVRFVDVEAIGPAGTSVGLSHLNNAVHRVLGFNMFWYIVTEVLGILAILTAVVFALIGLVQLWQRGSIRKVDGSILALGVLYTAVIVLYILFEKLVVNYRPVLMPGYDVPEASFPSSHTMSVCVVMGSALMLMRRYVKPGQMRQVLTLICAAVMVITVLGRLFSGVHWFTDILAGVLISIALLSLFQGILRKNHYFVRRRKQSPY